MIKSALITGGARRIGACIATTLHQAGFNVTIHFHQSTDEANALVTTLNNIRSHSAIAICADLTNESARSALINAHVEAWQQLDVLVNNASLFYPTPLTQATHEHYQDLMGCNVEAPFALSQLSAQFLRKTHGHIINIVDIYAKSPLKNHALYSASKAALYSLTKSLALELAPHVRVNGIAPGNILWPNDEIPNDVAQQNIMKIPLQRQGDPTDIANAVLFLIQQTYITGQAIRVDGGKGL